MAYNFAKQKLFGIGLNIFQYQIVFNYQPKKYFYDITPAHNIFAQILSGVGFIGLACWLIFCFLILKNSFQNLTNYKKKSKNDNNLINKFRACKQKIPSGSWKTAKFAFINNLFSFTIIFSFICISQFYPWFFSQLLAPIFWLYLGAAYAQKN